MKKQVAAIMMYGYPATGKTFISKKIENSLKKKYFTIRITTLDIRKKFKLFNLESDVQRDIVYDLLSKKVGKIVKSKKFDIIIIDGNFNKRSRREKIYSIFWNKIIYVIKCVVSNEGIIKQRMMDRQKNIDISENKAATIKLYRLIRDSCEDVEEDNMVKKKTVNLIQFNSENEAIEKIILTRKNHLKDITKEIFSTLNEIKL